MSSIFLSHSHEDKSFARKLTKDLRQAGHVVWVDEAEINIGDSLTEKIRDGIDRVDYVAAILSSKSVNSEWVKKELDIASNREMEEKRVVVLPILMEDVKIPGFLKGKLYADFRNKEFYQDSFAKLLNSLDLVEAIPKYSDDEVASLKAELAVVRSVVEQHSRELDRRKKLLAITRSSRLQAAIEKANKEFPAHRIINEAYAFEIGNSPVTLDRLFWAIGKAQRRGSHPLEALLTLEDKWDYVSLMLEAYSDILKTTKENSSQDVKQTRIKSAGTEQEGFVPHEIELMEQIVDELQEWAKVNTDDVEVSGEKWRDRMPRVIDLLRELGPVMDWLLGWKPVLGGQVQRKGKDFICRGGELLQTATSDPKYSLSVTDFRCGINDFADRLLHIAEMTRRDLAHEKPAKTTPQNFATNVLGLYEEKITKALNKFAHRQDDPELARLYISYSQLLEVSQKSAKKYLKKDLPDLPILTKSNCYVGMINLADYCRNCAAILMGKTGISDKEQKNSKAGNEKVAETEQGNKDTKKEMWYQNRTIQAAMIGAGVLLFVSIVGWLILLYINKSNVEQSEIPNLPGNSVVVNNVVYDTQPMANKIIAEIESLPAYEQRAAAENYKGRLFKWSLRFDNLVRGIDGTVYVICQASAVRGEVTFTINPDEKENLKIKKIKKGKFLDVSGEIEDIFLVREPQIMLKDVRLKFFD